MQYLRLQSWSLLSILALSVASANPDRPNNGGGGGGANIADLPTGDVVVEGNGPFQLSNHNEIVQELNSIDLEQTSLYRFELSGQTSVHLKAKRSGAPDGTFITRNEATNANSEIAYFNMARMIGSEDIFRAVIPYTLESNAIAVFKNLIQSTTFTGTMRRRNAANILAMIRSNPDEMKGAFREDKRGDDVAIDSLATNNRPNLSHQLLRDINAANPKPTTGRTEFRERYWAPRAKVAHQYSMMMTLDTVFGQWDRYSGSNVVFRIVDADTREIELYSTDNGGSDYWNTTSWATKQASWFSRYDRSAIEGLKAVYSFLTGRASSLRSVRLDKTWTDPEEFIVDLGLYYEKRPSQYVREVAANIGVLLKAVEANYNRYGDAVFF